MIWKGLQRIQTSLKTIDSCHQFQTCIKGSFTNERYDVGREGGEKNFVVKSVKRGGVKNEQKYSVTSFINDSWHIKFSTNLWRHAKKFETRVQIKKSIFHLRSLICKSFFIEKRWQHRFGNNETDYLQSCFQRSYFWC